MDIEFEFLVKETLDDDDSGTLLEWDVSVVIDDDDSDIFLEWDRFVVEVVVDNADEDEVDKEIPSGVIFFGDRPIG